MQNNVILPLSTQDVVEFIPTDQKDKAKPITYILKVPTRRDQAKLQREIILEGCRLPSDDELFAQMRKCLEITIVDKEVLTEVLEIVERVEVLNVQLVELVADPKTNEKEIIALSDNEFTSQYQELENQVRKLWQPYRDLLAEKNYYIAIVPELVARSYVTCVQNAEFELDTQNGKISEQSVQNITLLHISEIFRFSNKLIMPSKATVKNLKSPLKSQPDQKTSAVKES